MYITFRKLLIHKTSLLAMSRSKIKKIKVSQIKSTNGPEKITVISLYVVPELALDPKVASFISCGLCFLIEF